MPHTLAAQEAPPRRCRSGVNLVTFDEALLGGDTAATHIAGYGPIPAAVAQRLFKDALAGKGPRATLHRLHAHPKTGTRGGISIVLIALHAA